MASCQPNNTQESQNYQHDNIAMIICNLFTVGTIMYIAPICIVYTHTYILNLMLYLINLVYQTKFRIKNVFFQFKVLIYEFIFWVWKYKACRYLENNNLSNLLNSFMIKKDCENPRKMFHAKRLQKLYLDIRVLFVNSISILSNI